MVRFAKMRGVVLLIGSCLLNGLAQAGQVIAHESVQLDASEVREVFLGEKLFVDKLRLVPLDNLADQERFLAEVLQTDARHYAARWVRKSFRAGVAPPQVKGSDAETLAFVRSNAGSVGYIASNLPAAGVKVLFAY
jgi:hypothetical protein